MQKRSAATFAVVISASLMIGMLWLSAVTTVAAQPASRLPAQNQEITPTPNGYPPLTLAPEELQRQYDEIATLEAERLSHSIFDYHVAYLIKADTPPLNEVTTPKKIAEATGAKIANTWEDFLKLNEEQLFQIVLVHISMIDALDLEWTHKAYRNNVVLVGINFSHEQVKTMTGDQCLRSPNPTVKESDHTASFRYFVYSAGLQNEQYRDVVDKAELEDCKDDYEVGQVGVFHGTIHFWLETDKNLEGLVGALISDTMNYAGRTDPAITPSYTPTSG